jgi:Ca2+-binding RTX toxin-like protein
MAAFYGTRGADTFIGTDQNDQFYVNNVDDTIISDGRGFDTVVSTIDWTLGQGVDNLNLTGLATYATGNDLGNFIAGNRYDNILTGGRGIDRLTGGAGADTFVFVAGGRQHADYLNDFTSGTDRLAIAGDAFGVAAGATFDYVEDWNSLGSGPAFIRESLTDLAPTIWFDPDGAGGAAAQLLCTLQWRNNGTTASDFAIL